MWDLNIIAATLLTLLSISIVSIYWYLTNSYKYWEKRNLSYIKPSIPFGNLQNVYTKKITLGQAFGEAYLHFKQMGHKHGGIWALNSPIYIPVDPDIIKHIVISDSDKFPNHGFYFNETGDPLSAHLFNMEGNRWREIRSKLMPTFTSSKLKEMFSTIVTLSEEFQKRVDLVNDTSPDGIEIRSEFVKFTIDIISNCGYGINSGTMKDNNTELLKHANLFFDYQFSIYKNSMIFALPRNVLNKIYFRTFKVETEQFVKKLFGEMITLRKKDDFERHDIAHQIMKLAEKKDDQKTNGEMKPLNENEFIAQMWVFLCASFETSSSTQTFALYELSKQPEYQRRLREEINTVLAKHDNKLTYEAVMEMKYLECVVDGK